MEDRLHNMLNMSSSVTELQLQETKKVVIRIMQRRRDRDRLSMGNLMKEGILKKYDTMMAKGRVEDGWIHKSQCTGREFLSIFRFLDELWISRFSNVLMVSEGSSCVLDLRDEVRRRVVSDGMRYG
jgi:hypothetical protein